MGMFDNLVNSGLPFFSDDSANAPSSMFRNLSNSEQQGPIDIKTGTPGSTQSSNPAADALIQMSQEIYGQTAPLRAGIIDRGNAFLQGNLDVTGTPMFQALRSGADQQYSRARENILANTPTGGALSDALAQNELAKARTLTQGAGGIAQDEYNKVYGLATGAPGAALSGLGSAGQAQAQQAAARAQERSAVINSKGQAWGGAGNAMGSK